MTFPTQITAYTPTLPQLQGEIPGDLRDMAIELGQASARLAGRVPAGTQEGIIELLRSVNSYYSNLIEGHHTRLADAERALRNDYDADDDKRFLQMEAVAHIHTEQALEQRLQEEPALDVTSPAFIRWLHAHFYEQMPEEFRVVTSESGRKRKVVPGEFRDEEVEVGRHLPPRHDSIARFLQHFQQSYRLDWQHGDTKFIAAAASHQRLAWIHPFLDGNGRTARLFSHAYFSRIAGGYRLWSISRGLARRRSDYMAMLAAADAPRRNDLDGRGSLSAVGLANFCRFFLGVGIDQATFMDDLLRLDKLRARIEDYAERRSRGLIPQQEPIRKEAITLLVEIGMRGHVARGEVQKITGLGERVARSLVSDLLKKNLLLSPTHKAPLRLAFSSETTEYYLPSLYTGEIE